MLPAINVLIISCAALATAGGYVETSWPPHGALKTSGAIRSNVPTISYHYQPRKRHRVWRGRHYSSQPKDQELRFEERGDTAELQSAGNIIPSSGVYRTYGKGRAIIPYNGAVVQVPRTLGTNKAYKAVVSGRVFDPPKKPNWETNDVISRSRRDCASCPFDEMVVASKGNSFVLLPEPCSYKWQTISGPKPGTKLTEGVHFIMGTIGNMGNRKKVCQYKYEVKVRHCPPLQGQNVEVFCTADNAWGSKCNFTCADNQRIEGTPTSECNDELKWSSPEPTCKDTRDCRIPEIKNGTKFHCESNDISNAGVDYLPEHTYCRLNTNGIESAMRCKKGEWKKVSPKGKHRKNKYYKQSDLNPCNPNPCLHGGSCMVSSNQLHSTFICACPPQHEGPRCEFSECFFNPCQNEGRCFQVGGKVNCFCKQDFTGKLCQDALSF